MLESPQDVGERWRSSRSVGWILFALSWFLIAVNSCFAGQSIIRGFCERTVPLGMLFLTALTTAGCGSFLLGPWRLLSDIPEEYQAKPQVANPRCKQDVSRRPLEFLALSSALGWAVLSLLLCLLAACGQFSPGVFVPLSFLCSAIFGVGQNRGISGYDTWRAVNWRIGVRIYSRTFMTLAAGLLTLVVVGMTFLWACGPVWDYDSEMYHLPNAASILRQHGLVISHEEPLANLSGQAYLWFALGLAAGAEAYSALVVCWATLMTSLLAASVASRWFGVHTALWTIPVYWSALIVHAVASTPRIEPLYSMLFLAAVTRLLEAVQRRYLAWPSVVFCGICLGTAASVKAQGLYGWPVIGVWWCWVWLSQRHWRTLETIVRLTCMFLIGFVILTPWWVKNYRAFGNPVHPMFNRQVDPESLRNANPHVPHHASRPWYFLARDTFDLFAKPNTFSGPPGQWPHYLFLLLPLLTVVGFSKSRQAARGQPDSAEIESSTRQTAPTPWRSTTMTLLGISGGYYLMSLTLTHELRHQYGMFSLASILAAHVIAQIGVRWRMDLFLPGVVCFLLGFVILFPARLLGTWQIIRYLSGANDSTTTRESIAFANYSRSCEWCNENLPNDAVVLLCWESRIFRLHRSVITDPGACTWRTLFHNRETPDEVRGYLRRQKVDYVLVNEASLVYNVTKSKLISEDVYAEFRRQRDVLVPSVLSPVFKFSSDRSVSIYRVR
jgi:hypothetical protein